MEKPSLLINYAYQSLGIWGEACSQLEEEASVQYSKGREEEDKMLGGKFWGRSEDTHKEDVSERERNESIQEAKRIL